MQTKWSERLWRNSFFSFLQIDLPRYLLGSSPSFLVENNLFLVEYLWYFREILQIELLCPHPLKSIEIGFWTTQITVLWTMNRSILPSLMWKKPYVHVVPSHMLIWQHTCMILFIYLFILVTSNEMMPIVIYDRIWWINCVHLAWFLLCLPFIYSKPNVLWFVWFKIRGALIWTNCPIDVFLDILEENKINKY